MSTIIHFLGSPGIGKSRLAMKLALNLDTDYSAFYVPECIKDYSNRKWAMPPEDQLHIFGAQIFDLNSALAAGYDHVVTCTSPILCAFYVNYYSEYKFLSLNTLVHQYLNWMESKGHKHIFVFPTLEEEMYRKRYESSGRYESIDESLKLQIELVNFVERYYSDLKISQFNYTDDITPKEIREWHKI